MPTRPVTIKLSPDLDRRVTGIARREGLTRSAVIRRAIEAYAPPEVGATSTLDLFGAAVGALEGGPVDLATNPTHLDDLGR